MAFHLRPGEYFVALIVENYSSHETVVAEYVSRAETVRVALCQAREREADWVIELRCRDPRDLPEDGTTTVIARWSSAAGILPPKTRGEVDG